jgi:sugar lactone lactonase YvrE
MLSAATLVVLAGAALGPVVTAQAQVVKVLNRDAYFPEGPIWHQGKLYYVEYGRNTVMTWDGRDNAVFASDPGCGQSAVVPTAAGEFLTTCYDNGTIGRMAANGKLLPPYTHDKDGNKFIGPNDLAPDSHGGTYFTASGSPSPAIDGRVFYIAADGTITLAADNLRNANGLAISRDGNTLYVVETEENRLVKFDIGPNAALANRRVFVNLNALVNHVGPIWPDGVKIDSKGMIYIGQSPRDVHAVLTGKILVVDAAGRWVRTLSLPSTNVPNFAFSPDEKTLYVTAVDDIDHAPNRGKVYSIPND